MTNPIAHSDIFSSDILDSSVDASPIGETAAKRIKRISFAGTAAIGLIVLSGTLVAFNVICTVLSEEDVIVDRTQRCFMEANTVGFDMALFLSLGVSAISYLQLKRVLEKRELERSQSELEEV